MNICAVLIGIIFLSLAFARRRIIFRTTETSDCGGSNSTIEFQSSSLRPDVILNPGFVYISAEINFKRNISLNGVRLKMKLVKLEPRRMNVPCFRRFGSCSYDVCQMLFDNPDKLCPMFPSGLPCDCQAAKGLYRANRTPLQLPDFGRMFIRIMQGNYEGNATFIDQSGNQIGCLNMIFSIKNKLEPS